MVDAVQTTNLIAEIRDRMTGGEVVIIPTPLSYIFVIDSRNAAAADRVLALKGVPADDEATPFGFLTRQEQITQLGSLTPAAEQLITLWPAPLSIMIPKAPSIPDWITPYRSIAVACPNSFCAELVALTPFAIACLAANPAGEFLVTRYGLATQLYQDKVHLIVDGGQCPLGMASTMVDCSITPPVMARYGPVSLETLRQILPDLQLVSHLMK